MTKIRGQLTQFMKNYIKKYSQNLTIVIFTITLFIISYFSAISIDLSEIFPAKTQLFVEHSLSVPKGKEIDLENSLYKNLCTNKYLVENKANNSKVLFLQ